MCSFGWQGCSDNKNVECAKIECWIDSLEPGDSAVISFNARLWNRTISEVCKWLQHVTRWLLYGRRRMKLVEICFCCRNPRSHSSYACSHVDTMRQKCRKKTSLNVDRIELNMLQTYAKEYNWTFRSHAIGAGSDWLIILIKISKRIWNSIFKKFSMFSVGRSLMKTAMRPQMMERVFLEGRFIGNTSGNIVSCLDCFVRIVPVTCLMRDWEYALCSHLWYWKNMKYITDRTDK